MSSFLSLYRYCIRSPKIPLRLLLVASFVLQVSIVAGGVCCLFWHQDQQKTRRHAEEFLTGVNERVNLYLDNYLAKPTAIHRNNDDSVKAGLLDLSNPSKVEHYLFHQLRQLDVVSSVAYINPKGDLKIVNRAGGYELISINTRDGIHESYRFDRQGKWVKQGHSPLKRQPQNYLWYSLTGTSRSSVWGPIFYDSDRHLTVNVSRPVYELETGQLLGVFSLNLILNQLSEFLQEMDIYPSAEVFIIDRHGLIVATSSKDSLYQSKSSSRRLYRVRAADSRSFEVATAAQYLEGLPVVLGELRKQLFHFKSAGNEYFMQVLPYQDRHDLDWMIVTIVPKAELFASSPISSSMVLLLLGGAILGAVILGILTSYWIARPISLLSRASRDLTLGKWNYPVQSHSAIAELEILIHSFNQMAEQLELSFDQVKLALEQSEEKFTKIFHTSPDPITISTLKDGRYLDANESCLKIMGFTREEVVGQTSGDLKVWCNPEDRSCFLETLRLYGWVRNLEVPVCDRSGRSRMLLLSAEVIELNGQPCVLTVAKDITDRKRTEEALRQSEATNRALIQAIPDLLIRVHRDGTYLDVHHVGNIPRLDPNELVAGNHIYQILPPDLAQERMRYVHQALQTGRLQTYEYELKIGGELYYEEARITPCGSDEVLVIVRNISESKRAEAALRQSEAQFRGIFDHLPAGMCIVTLAGRYLQVNNSLCKMFGYTEAEFLTLTYQSLTHPDDLQLDLELSQQVLDGKLPYFRMEKRYLRKDGSILWGFLSACLVRDGQQQPLYFVSHIQDITDRKLAEQALRQSETRFRSAFDYSAVGMCITSLTGRYLQVNSSLCRMLGYTEPELLSLNFWDITHSDDLQQDLDYTQRMIAGELSFFHLEKRYQRKDGSLLWGLLSVSLVRDDQQNPAYVVSHIQDVTPGKLAEQAFQESQTQLRLVMETTPCLLWTSHRDSSIQFGNLCYLEFLGLDSGQLEGQSWFKFVHPDDVDRVGTHWMNAIARKTEYWDKFRLQRAANGEYYWFRSHALPFHSQDGQVVQWVVTCIEVGHRSPQANAPLYAGSRKPGYG